MTHTFLLEVGLEDMPAHVVLSAEQQLVEKTKAFLGEMNLGFESIVGFSTPRRFAVKIDGLEEKQADEELTVRGPAKRIAQDEEGNWSKAAIGFSRGQGGTVDDLIIKDEDGEPYVYIEKFIEGKPASDILQGLASVIEKIEFPKNMKWGTTNYQYVRPIHWIVALLDETVVPFDVFEVSTGKQTEGHRFLGESIELSHPDEYESRLEAEYVIADRAKRQEMIVHQIQTLCEEKNWLVPTEHADLLEEVTDLVEYPTAFYGAYEESYLTVPDVVLETSMKDHQRYFPVRSNDAAEEILPYFIAVRNGNEEHIENVARGNEKVLTARLADSMFFYEEDQKTDIATFVDKLKHIKYHEKLGAIYDRQVRGTNMVPVLAKYFDLSDTEVEDLTRLTEIYKFDLVTQVVDEFPTLQATIGAIYAADRNESEAVSVAIGEQYLPSSVKGVLPETKLGLFIALIDKLDALIQFFSVDLIPTGSNDPYALRRQAIGVVRILLELNQSTVDLEDLLNDLVEASQVPADREEKLEENMRALIAFIKDRLEQLMQAEYNIPHDIRQAALGSNNHNVTWNLEVAQVLEEQKSTEAFKEVVESITRVINMTKKQTNVVSIASDLLETETEKRLVVEIEQLEQKLTETIRAKDLYDLLAQVSPHITAFYDNNMVMVDDEKVKENRLTLLSHLANTAKYFADFSQLVI